MYTKPDLFISAQTQSSHTNLSKPLFLQSSIHLYAFCIVFFMQFLIMHKKNWNPLNICSHYKFKLCIERHFTHSHIHDWIIVGGFTWRLAWYTQEFSMSILEHNGIRRGSISLQNLKNNVTVDLDLKSSWLHGYDLK